MPKRSLKRQVYVFGGKSVHKTWMIVSRNNVSDRIRHWIDLEQKHAAILDVIGWVSPELHEMASALDRFTEIRKAGLPPWIEISADTGPMENEVATAK